MSEIIKKYLYFGILSCIFLFGIALRLKFLIANPSFWNDECSLGWNIADKNYIDFFYPLYNSQVAPVFFLIMAKAFTNIFGLSDLVLRFVPFVFGILSMMTFFLLSNKIFDNKITSIASTLIFSFNQNLVNYSSEFKQYSCDVFFTLLCLYLFLDLIINKISLKKKVFYSLIFAISIWFSFVSIFVIAAGIFVYVLKALKQNDFDIRVFFKSISPLFISVLIFLFYILNIYSSSVGGLMGYWKDSFIAKDFSNFFPLVISDIKYFLFPSVFILPAILSFIAGIIILFKKKFYFSLILLLTIFFECFASWLGIYPFEKRVILFLLPIVLIFIAAVFEVINFKKKIKSTIILFLFLIIFIQPLSYSYNVFMLKKPTRGYYSREMMAEMMKKIDKNEIIVVNEYSEADFAYYSRFYKVKNKVIQEGKQSDRSTFLNSLTKGRYWFYMPFGASPTFDEYFRKSPNKILLEMSSKDYPSKLVYVYIQ